MPLDQIFRSAFLANTPLRVHPMIEIHSYIIISRKLGSQPCTKKNVVQIIEVQITHVVENCQEGKFECRGSSRSEPSPLKKTSGGALR
jgi:hypothetical protein